MDNQLEIIINESGLEPTKAQYILDNFQDYFKIAADWGKRALTIVVTNESQKIEMQLARTGRLFLREKRITIEKERKKLKEQSLREGKAIDGIANILKSLIIPIEEYLDNQEHFIEIREKEKAELARIETEQKAEKERIAKEEAEREEQERIRMENLQLKKEAIKKERAMGRERKKAIAEKKALEERACKELDERERIAKIEHARQEKILAEQKAKAAAEKKALEQKLKKQVICPHCGGIVYL